MFPEQDSPLTWNLSNQAVVQVFKVLFNEPMVKKLFCGDKISTLEYCVAYKTGHFCKGIKFEILNRNATIKALFTWRQGYPGRRVTLANGSQKRTLT